MLDRASLRTLAQHPERNDPLLNVALAEEGDAEVLFALAECPGVGPEALAKIAARIASEGELVGHRPEVDDDDFGRGARRSNETAVAITNGTDLDARIVVHPRADDEVRDAILERRKNDAFFVLAAAAHPHATVAALERAIRWSGATPMHDRPWLGLIDRSALSPLLLEGWAGDDDPLAREAAARLSRDRGQLEALARDPSRQVRRAVASNPAAGAAREELAAHDTACEVRARAATAQGAPRDEVDARRGVDPSAPRFKSAVAAMTAGGLLASDVARALCAGPLDPEGARLAAMALDEGSVGSVVVSCARGDPIGVALAAGVALRDDAAHGSASDLLLRCAHALASDDRSGGVVTGKGRLAAWLADGVASVVACAPGEVVRALGRGSLAADRMVLGRLARASAASGESIRSLAMSALDTSAPVPLSLIELAWRDPKVGHDALERMAARAHAPDKLDSSVEQEADLDPRARPLEVLERVGNALIGRAPLSPRAALALVALEPRRVRYVLSAMPQWKGVLTGANVARVLRSHAGALTAAGPSGPRRASSAPAGWTQRRLDELEVAVALAIGDLGARDAVARLGTGQYSLSVGTALAAGIEARASLEGAAPLEPLAELLSRRRSQDAAALAAWLLIEALDRPRSGAAIAAALDAPWAVPAAVPVRTGSAGGGTRGVVAPGLAEALATLERRAPGRLATVTPQTPRGRAALVSGIARAYRALGGMSVSEG